MKGERKEIMIRYHSQPKHQHHGRRHLDQSLYLHLVPSCLEAVRWVEGVTVAAHEGGRLACTVKLKHLHRVLVTRLKLLLKHVKHQEGEPHEGRARHPDEPGTFLVW